MVIDVPWAKTEIDIIEFHIWPPNDGLDHEFYILCPCKPLVEIEKYKDMIIAKAVVHKAQDDRPGPLTFKIA